MSYYLNAILNNDTEIIEEFIDAVESIVNDALVGTTVRQLLAASTDTDVREVVARSRQTPVELLQMLAVDYDEDVRMAVAMNENVTEEILIMLAHDEEEDIRVAVGEVEVGADVLRVLADDHSDKVRIAVALHWNTDKETLIGLASDEDCRVRTNVAGMLPVRRECPLVLETLTLLSKDIDPGVRTNVAGNAATPRAVVEMLANDEHEFVKSTAISALAGERVGKILFQASEEEE